MEVRWLRVQRPLHEWGKNWRNHHSLFSSSTCSALKGSFCSSQMLHGNIHLWKRVFVKQPVDVLSYESAALLINPENQEKKCRQKGKIFSFWPTLSRANLMQRQIMLCTKVPQSKNLTWQQPQITFWSILAGWCHTSSWSMTHGFSFSVPVLQTRSRIKGWVSQHWTS